MSTRRIQQEGAGVPEGQRRERVGGSSGGRPGDEGAGAPGGSRPPYANQGGSAEGLRLGYAKAETLGVDWLTVTCRGAIGALGEVVAEVFWRSLNGKGGGVFWEDTGHGMRFWGRFLKGPMGSRLLGDNTQGGGWSCVELPGEMCQVLGIEGCRELLKRVRRLGGEWRVTRMDLAWDHVGFSGEDLIAEAMAGTMTARGKWLEYGSPPTRTFYLGRTGEMRLCVYHKLPAGFNRCELRIWGEERLREVVGHLVGEDDTGFGRWALGALRGFVAFRGASWEALVGGAKPVRLRRSRPGPVSQERVRRYVEGDLAKSLAKYVAIAGWDALGQVVARGAKLINAVEWAELGLQLGKGEFDLLGRVAGGREKARAEG